MFGLWGAARYYRLLADAPDAAARLAARDAILDSPYMSTNNLNERFKGTYGFSVVFRREGLSEVRERFPAFAPFLDRVLVDGCNAFFLNPLLVADGGAVAPHVDLSLQTYVPDVTPPYCVSVWYVAVPPGLTGGALRLYRELRQVAELPPQEGRLLSFKGDLRHDVAPVTGGAPGIYDARLSLVVEQYRVPDPSGVPLCLIGSRREGAGTDRPLSGGVGEGAFGEALKDALDG